MAESTFCIICGAEIPEGRLHAIKGCMTCVNCSIVEKKKGFRIISGKTTYLELDIVDAQMFKILSGYERKTNGAFFTSTNRPTDAEKLTNGCNNDIKLFKK